MADLLTRSTGAAIRIVYDLPLGLPPVRADANQLELALLNLVAMSVPVGLAGWGPREGAAAWSFAVTGLGAAQGVAVATTYGVLAAVATLPGLVVVVATWCRRRGTDAPLPLDPAVPLEPAARPLPGGAHV